MLSKILSVALLPFSAGLWAQSELTQIEQCWGQKQTLVEKSTQKIGKSRSYHLSTVACKTGEQTLKAVEIEYKMLIANNNRFASEENRHHNDQHYYETRLVYIDADELGAMIEQLHNLHLQLNSPRRDTTEIHYTSRAGFRVYAVYQPRGERWSLYVEFPDKKRNNLTRNALLDLIALLKQAQTQVEG